METFFFYLFAVVSVVGALLVITLKNIVHSALSLLASFIAVAGLFLIINAEFIAIVQILIYAGAVMILFLFAIFLLDIPRMQRTKQYLKQRNIALPFIGGFAVLMTALIAATTYTLGQKGTVTEAYVDSVGGNIEVIGKVMYTKYILPFEIVSILLLAAMIGAIVISRKELK